MASPPPGASRGLHSLAQSKKRSSELTLTPASQPLKRRKPSNWSQSSVPLSAHPLRQTSFPPEPGSPTFSARFPSVDAVSVISSSTLNATGPPRKKRGRKPKNLTAAVATGTSYNGDGGSVASGRDGTTAGQIDDEDGDEEEVNLAVVDTVRTLEQKQEEQRLRGMLVEAFDDDQYSRYEVWRASKLSDAVIKRVINTTVSQSVPPAITLAVKSVTKQFAGNIIEMARQVQAEWIAAGEIQADISPPQVLDPVQLRGPLRPDHLREAWRRYKSLGEGGGVGSHTSWHNQQSSGVARFATKTGKCLFW